MTWCKNDQIAVGVGYAQGLETDVQEVVLSSKGNPINDGWEKKAGQWHLSFKIEESVSDFLRGVTIQGSKIWRIRKENIMLLLL